jgi:hypothetical protein
MVLLTDVSFVFASRGVKVPHAILNLKVSEVYAHERG